MQHWPCPCCGMSSVCSAQPCPCWGTSPSLPGDPSTPGPGVQWSVGIGRAQQRPRGLGQEPRPELCEGLMTVTALTDVSEALPSSRYASVFDTGNGSQRGEQHPQAYRLPVSWQCPLQEAGEAQEGAGLPGGRRASVSLGSGPEGSSEATLHVTPSGPAETPEGSTTFESFHFLGRWCPAVAPAVRVLPSPGGGSEDPREAWDAADAVGPAGRVARGCWTTSLTPTLPAKPVPPTGLGGE